MSATDIERSSALFRTSGVKGVDLVALFNASPNPYLILDRDYTIIGMNAAYLRATMRERDELLGGNMFDVFPSDPNEPGGRMLRSSFAQVLRDKVPHELPLIRYPIAGADGEMEERFWSATHMPMFGEDGEVAFILQHTVDVTELHRLRTGAAAPSVSMATGVLRRAASVQVANAALDEERAYLRSLFEQAPSFMAILHGPDYRFTLANAAYLQLIGHRDVLGMTVAEALPEVAGQGFVELLDHVYASGRAFVGTAVRVSLQRAQNGPLEPRFLDLVYQPLRDAEGHVDGIFMQGHDVTEQKRAEAAAWESEARFRSLAQSMPNHVWTAQADGQLDWFNEPVYDYSGARHGDLNGAAWAAIIHPDDVDDAMTTWQAARDGGVSYQTEFRIRRSDGAYRWHLVRAVPVTGADGGIVRWVGTNTDIHDQKSAEAALANQAVTLEQRVEARTAELFETRDALRQSQKMEAIGNLTGGIAHDFNNLLQVIGGNLQLLSRDLADNERAQKRVHNALIGVSRGAKLATQLLAFGRRQPLEPKVVNIGRFIRGMDDILRRSLGEAIEVETVVAAGLWNTHIDPGNVENALLNLAINARDAMGDEGRLTIEASNAFLDAAYARAHGDLTAGQYVMLAITDTGCGMSPDMTEKVFEPFFTTKPEGKGTGLGLSMVYGFVKQSGGHVKIYSELGQGTTVKLYLPRCTQPEDVLTEMETGPVVGGSETILVAEDDEAVRETAVAMLGELGYRVLKAKDAQAALTIIESGLPIDLLFTDVVMPGPLRSPELARKARERLPRLAVLFTSGYTENAIVHGGRLDAGVNLLGKPYTREALAQKIRHLLGNRAQAGLAAVPSPARVTAPPARSTILTCEDDALIRMNTADTLQDLGYTVVEAATAAEALAALQSATIDILLTDVGLPDMSGVELARLAVQARPSLGVIFATGHTHVPGAEAIANAVMLTKPYGTAALSEALSTLLQDVCRDPPKAGADVV